MHTVDLKRLRLKPGARALDLGCGEGRHVHALYYAARMHVVGVDLCFDDLAKVREGFAQAPDLEAPHERAFSLSVGNALRLPFADESFDLIVCSEVLEHIPEFEEALNEITRLLKPGGQLAISVPRFWPEWLCWKLAPGYYKTPGGHVRIFRASRLRGEVTTRGFRHAGGHWAHGLHSPYWWLQCAVWKNREANWFVRQYHKFLCWDILKRPLLTRMLEKIADPLMGKSVVMYFDKPTESA
jgi:SAM-dependent methyltransferase